jgi:hypothetical protein
VQGAERPTIGVIPPAEFNRRERLFGALESAYPVRFEAREDGELRHLSAVVSVGTERIVPSPRMPVLSMQAAERRRDMPSPVKVLDAPEIDRPLRGAELTDRFSGALTDGMSKRDFRVLAMIGDQPAWVRDASGGGVVSVAPEELGEREALRNRLRPGRCLSLLALVHFLRRLSAAADWSPPPVGAAFILDDPNLHWPTYGHVRYRELAEHAATHGYHVAIAMVPYDGWLGHPRAVRIFRQHPRELSLCVHGNDHDGPELGRITSMSAGVALAAQALERAAAFQHRTGIRFDKVMVPPHEQLSETASQALLACGYEAVSASRPRPWLPMPQDGPRWTSAPGFKGTLAGWQPREIVADGLPLMLRAGIDAPREDLALRAWLGQPLILYGHHDLLKHGPDVLAEAAKAIRALGEVTWGSLGDLARSGYQTRRDGDRLALRLLARRASVSPTPDVETLEVDLAGLASSAGTRLTAVLRRDVGFETRSQFVGEDPVLLSLHGVQQVELILSPAPLPRTSPPGRGGVRKVVRRLAQQGRDRTQAVLASSRL